MDAFILRHIKKVLILMVGGTVLLIGIVFIILPGPAFIIIPLGLGILAVEFSWARKILARARRTISGLFPKAACSANPNEPRADRWYNFKVFRKSAPDCNRTIKSSGSIGAADHKDQPG